MQGYYQEAGRAGRDGQQSECILLWARRDIARFVMMHRTKPKAARERAHKSLLEVHSRHLHIWDPFRRDSVGKPTPPGLPFSNRELFLRI